MTQSVGVPVYLHLLKRHRSETQQFASLMFFEKSVQADLKHRRLDYLLLLAARLAGYHGPRSARLACVVELLHTATPLQNDVMELLGLAAFIDDALLGNEEAFRLQYAAGELDEEERNTLAARDELGVDQHVQLVARVGGVDDDHALVHVDLRGSQADARRGVHRFGHVGDELAHELRRAVGHREEARPHLAKVEGFAGLLEQPRHPLGVVDVHLAAVGFDEVLHFRFRSCRPSPFAFA